MKILKMQEKRDFSMWMLPVVIIIGFIIFNYFQSIKHDEKISELNGQLLQIELKNDRIMNSFSMYEDSISDLNDSIFLVNAELDSISKDENYIKDEKEKEDERIENHSADSLGIRIIELINLCGEVRTDSRK